MLIPNQVLLLSAFKCVYMNLNQNFQRIYNQLNDEQRKAVDKIEGPVMVIAGPGTGKTQILSARIGKILLETDTLPENILCSAEDLRSSRFPAC